MNKKDLKPGMYVTLRSGVKFMVVTGCDPRIYGDHVFYMFADGGKFMHSDRFRDDLTAPGGGRYDIVLVEYFIPKIGLSPIWIRPSYL